MIEFIIKIATLFLGYVASATCAGAFRAWVAKKMGDDTAYELGYLTFNPLKHIDFLGTCLLLFFGFGWGRYVPINPFNIIGRWRRLRIIVATFSDVISYIITSIIASIILLSLFDTRILYFPCYSTLDCNNLSITSVYPDTSSIIIILGLVLIEFIYLNSVLAVMHIIINGTNMAFLLYNDSEYESDRPFYQDNYVVLSISLVLYFICAGPLFIFLFSGITQTSLILAKLIHLL